MGTTQLLLGQVRRPPPPVVRQDAEVLSGPTTSTVMMKTITPAATGTEGHAVITTSHTGITSALLVSAWIQMRKMVQLQQHLVKTRKRQKGATESRKGEGALEN